MAQKDQTADLQPGALRRSRSSGRGSCTRFPACSRRSPPVAARGLEVSLGRKEGTATKSSEALRATIPTATRRCGPRLIRPTCGFRSAATSSARIASCRACADRSRGGHPDHIFAEAVSWPTKAAARSRCLGQTVNSYRFRHGDGRTTRLSDLLAAAARHRRYRQRLKFVTNYPKDMTDDLLAAVRDLPKVFALPPRAGAERLERGVAAHEAGIHGRRLPRNARPHS